MNRKKLAVMLAVLVLLIAAGAYGIGNGKREEEPETKPTAETTEIRITQTKPQTEPETEPETQPETEPYRSPVNFEELWAVNPDVIGWITIPDTNIDYPILQGEDNETYLHMDLEGNETVAGSIYLDFEDEKDFSSLHNIIYGHHMKNGSMFKDIVRYKEQDYFNQHRDITIYTPEQEIHLKAFAALYTTPDPIRRKTVFSTEEGFDSYVREMTKKTVTYAEPEQKVKKLYSLVTCSYEFSNARTILYAYEVEEEEKTEAKKEPEVKQGPETEQEPELEYESEGAEYSFQ